MKTKLNLCDLPKILEVAPEKRKLLYKKKLKLCRLSSGGRNKNACTFSISNETSEDRLQALLEIMEFSVKFPSTAFQESLFSDIILTIDSIIFSKIVSQSDKLLSPSWPHLQIVYEFFLRFIVSSTINMKKSRLLLSNQFVMKLVLLLGGSDLRERVYLKTIIHRIYTKYTLLRKFIRKQLNYFLLHLNESEYGTGIVEVLDIYASIISGLRHPMKYEYEVFLRNVIIPLHGFPSISNFNASLVKCVDSYIDIDPASAVTVILGILRKWPGSRSVDRQGPLLSELVHLVEYLTPENFDSICRKLFLHFSKLLLFVVPASFIEKILQLWENNYVASLIFNRYQVIFPLVGENLQKLATQYWVKPLRDTASDILHTFLHLNGRLHPVLVPQPIEIPSQPINYL